MRLALALCLLVAPVTATADGTATLGSAPTLGGGSYSTGGGITVAVEPRRTTTGRLAICGIWAESRRLNGYVRDRAPEVLATGTIAVDGVAVLSNLRFLHESAPAVSYNQATAGCAVTDRRYTGAEQIEIWLPRQVIVRDRGGPQIRFGPADRDNPALGAGSVLPRSWTVFDSKGGKTGRDRPLK